MVGLVLLSRLEPPLPLPALHLLQVHIVFWKALISIKMLEVPTVFISRMYSEIDQLPEKQSDHLYSLAL